MRLKGREISKMSKNETTKFSLSPRIFDFIFFGKQSQQSWIWEFFQGIGNPRKNLLWFRTGTLNEQKILFLRFDHIQIRSIFFPFLFRDGSRLTEYIVSHPVGCESRYRKILHRFRPDFRAAASQSKQRIFDDLLRPLRFSRRKRPRRAESGHFVLLLLPHSRSKVYLKDKLSINRGVSKRVHWWVFISSES